MSKLYYNKEIIRGLNLPYPGKVFVEVGQEVKPSTLIAKTELLDVQPGYFAIDDFFNKDFTIQEVKSVIKVAIGDYVKRGDSLAEYNGMIYKSPYYGLVEHVSESGQYILIRQKVSEDEEPLVVDASKEIGISPRAIMNTLQVTIGQEVLRSQALAGDIKMVYTPMTGTVDDIVEDEGKILIKPYYQPKTLYANIYGEIKEIDNNQNISILTNVDLVQGEFGIGKEKTGTLKNINADFEQGNIIFTNKKISKQEMAKAIEDKASGIIAPSADADDLIDIFGEEIYTGVTGVEKHPVSVLLTEGFGDKVMLNETANLLENYIGQSITIIPKTNLQTPKKLPDIYLYKK